MLDDHKKAKEAQRQISSGQDGNDLQSQWMDHLQHKTKNNLERWERAESAITQASGALLSLKDRLPKYQKSIDKILLYLRKVQQSGRKNVDILEDYIKEQRGK